MATQPKPLSYYLELTYPYTVVPDGDAYFIEFPDLPNCMTQVEDASDIAAMAEEIRTLWIESEYQRGNSTPEPAMQSEYSGKLLVRLPKTLHRDLATAAQREGASLNAYVGYLLAQRNAVARVDARLASIEAKVDPSGPLTGAVSPY